MGQPSTEVKPYLKKEKWSKRKITRLGVIYFFLLLLASFTIIPFLWTISISLKGDGDPIFSMPPQFIPEHWTLNNFIEVWNTVPIPTYLRNSVLLTIFGVSLPLITSALAAFPLARMKFKGRQFLFILIISTMMIPSEVTMIPMYLVINELNLMGTFAGVIVPGALSPFGIFLLRQAFLNIPKEIEESAIIDGANVWQIFWRILLPMVKPMLGTLCILFFISEWNSFLWPLLILQDESMHPLTVGLYKLQGTFVTNTRLIAAGAMIALIPVIAVFIALQRSFIDAAFSSSIKG
ncbi:carbohydrate ABC transporter permease [Aureibacillus halotolerans]|uniref:Carbohydrate ABC transporter membrane protein 2 (CUT1 family) n=1 Tax=Aureibacillus halotolerans TaxID=1508390 RepID=A0A4R6UCX1_9BACI|nr:carbohydrate ABC transporter permease [Aureibacillus halotolerans]TDQ42983.1 carbohydrate ABC transporter membrane protein 2 (CUT1 family) [Aureibacillus halotolerans]